MFICTNIWKVNMDDSDVEMVQARRSAVSWCKCVWRMCWLVGGILISLNLEMSVTNVATV